MAALQQEHDLQKFLRRRAAWPITVDEDTAWVYSLISSGPIMYTIESDNMCKVSIYVMKILPGYIP